MSGAVCEVEERAGEEEEVVGDAEEAEEEDEILDMRGRETLDQPDDLHEVRGCGVRRWE
jgi:hypothetical protein